MAKQSAFRTFCDALQFQLNKPASAAQIKKAEEKFGIALPKPVRELYQTCDGAQAENELTALQLHSLKSALTYSKAPGFFDSIWRLWPLAENNDSNPLCVCCDSPLAGHLVLVSHDDSPRLLFRSLDSFFAVAAKLVASGESLDTSELPGDFAAGVRSKQDLAIARQLIALTRQEETLDEQEQIDALRFACDLLSDNDVDEIAELLHDDSEYVVEYATARLKRIASAPARKALGQSEDSFDSFVERCGQALQAAGIAANVVPMYGKQTIRLDPGPIWLNMEAFYAARKRPDFTEYFVDQVRAIAPKPKKRGPSKKPPKKKKK